MRERSQQLGLSRIERSVLREINAIHPRADSRGEAAAVLDRPRNIPAQSGDSGCLYLNVGHLQIRFDRRWRIGNDDGLQ